MPNCYARYILYTLSYFIFPTLLYSHLFTHLFIHSTYFMAGAIPNQGDFFPPFMFVQAEFQRHIQDIFNMSQQSAETKVRIFVEFHAVTLLDELPLKKWLQFYYLKKHA